MCFLLWLCPMPCHYFLLHLPFVSLPLVSLGVVAYMLMPGPNPPTTRPGHGPTHLVAGVWQDMEGDYPSHPAWPWWQGVWLSPLVGHVVSQRSQSSCSSVFQFGGAEHVHTCMHAHALSTSQTEIDGQSLLDRLVGDY